MESTVPLIKYRNTDWWLRIVHKRKRQKSKHQIRQPPKSCIFNKIYLKLFINAKNIYRILPPKSWCSSTSLTSLQQSPMTPFHTSEVRLVNFLIREKKNYPERWFVSFCQEMSRYQHHHYHVTPLLINNANPLITMDHHIYQVTCHHSPLHGSTPSSCHPSSLYVDHHLLFMQTITLVPQR